MNTKMKEGARNKGNPYFLKIPYFLKGPELLSFCRTHLLFDCLDYPIRSIFVKYAGFVC